MSDTGPMDYTHQTVVHQLNEAKKHIEGDGIVTEFDYDEEIDEYYDQMGAGVPVNTSEERTVTMELEFILPE